MSALNPFNSTRIDQPLLLTLTLHTKITVRNSLSLERTIKAPTASHYSYRQNQKAWKPTDQMTASSPSHLKNYQTRQSKQNPAPISARTSTKKGPPKFTQPTTLTCTHIFIYIYSYIFIFPHLYTYLYIYIPTANYLCLYYVLIYISIIIYLYTSFIRLFMPWNTKFAWIFPFHHWGLQSKFWKIDFKKRPIDFIRKGEN